MTQIDQDLLPRFKYYPEPLKYGSITKDHFICSICNQEREYRYNSIMFSKDWGRICPWCIADGSAAKKLEATFVYAESSSYQINNKDFENELNYRTPGHDDLSFEWPAHCDDYCKLVGKFNLSELKNFEQEINEDVQNMTKEYSFVKDEIKNDSLIVYLFECLKCKKHRILLPHSRINSEYEKEKDKKILPNFKYHPNPIETGVIMHKHANCPVCNKETEYVYEGPFYSTEDVKGICPWCIADGSAAEKFDGEFTEFEEHTTEDNEDELIHRTPGYYSIQSENWQSHCGDYCAFVGYVGWQEIKDIVGEIVPEDLEKIKEDVRWTQEEMEEYFLNNGDVQGYLFKCLKCGKYRLIADCT